MPQYTLALGQPCNIPRQEALPLSSATPAQADKDIAKAIAAMGELEAALAAKKEVSGRVKALKKEVEGARAEAGRPQLLCTCGAVNYTQCLSMAI